jgi:hypothetical protein
MIAKGKSVSFDMVNGDEIDAPASYAMLHDPTGKYWSKNSFLVMPFKKISARATPPKEAEAYLGRTHVIRVGDVSLPPKELSAWKYEGEVAKVWYTRTGKKHGGQRFQHGMNKPGLMRLFRGKRKVRLYSRGNVFRLELGHGAIVDDRGFVDP